MIYIYVNYKDSYDLRCIYKYIVAGDGGLGVGWRRDESLLQFMMILLDFPPPGSKVN